MKTSVFLAASGALLAMASPFNMEKRKMETVVEIEWKTVTVTEGAHPTIFAAGAHHHAPTQAAAPSSSLEPEPKPKPETVAPAPEPTTVAPSPTPEPTTTAPAPPPPAVETPAASHAPAAAETTEAAAPPPPASTVQAQAAQPSDYISTAVYHHNLHRLNHSAPTVEWGQTYADYAAQTAAKCVFAHDLSPGGGGYGQNLALFGGSGSSVKTKSTSQTVAESVTDMWYNGETIQFPWSDLGQANPNMGNFEGWGHFSQVVWAGTKQVGCATQFCPAGTIYDDMPSWYTVCNYYPAGNIGGAYGKNVLAPLGEATVTA